MGKHKFTCIPPVNSGHLGMWGTWYTSAWFSHVSQQMNYEFRLRVCVFSFVKFCYWDSFIVLVCTLFILLTYIVILCEHKIPS